MANRNQDGEVENEANLASVVEVGIFRKALKSIRDLLQDVDQSNPKLALIKARAIAIKALMQAHCLLDD